MAIDTVFFYTFLLIFVRSTSMFATSPIFNGLGVPVQVRIGLGGVLGLALAPVLRAHVGAVPTEMLAFIGAIAHEALIGILLGFLVTLLLSAAEMAGHFLDMQIGFGMMQLLNPQTQTTTTLLAGFKMNLAIVLFLILNGHHILLTAFAKSYEMAPGTGMIALQHLCGSMSLILSQILLLAVQIAAPVGATLIVADIAMAAMSRAVPQMPVFIIGAPAKIIVGMMSLAVALPSMAWAISYAITLNERQIGMLFKTLR
ncbi:MAG: flagellar biosynthetic protein FliR [bacterium]